MRPMYHYKIGVRIAHPSQISYGLAHKTGAQPSRLLRARVRQAGRLRSSQLQWSQLMTAPSYTEPHILAYPVEYLAGIDLYNEGEFHAAHDAWEERWMGPVAPDEKL